MDAFSTCPHCPCTGILHIYLAIAANPAASLSSFHSFLSFFSSRTWPASSSCLSLSSGAKVLLYQHQQLMSLAGSFQWLFLGHLDADLVDCLR